MATPHPDLVVAVLAGGASRRMGRDKASVPIGGMTMLERVLDGLAGVGERIVVGGPAPDPIPEIPDLRPGRRGPLAGLEAALAWAGGRSVALVAVDQPYVRAATLGALADLPGDATVPIDQGHPQVTCAVYRPACLPVARALLEGTGRTSVRAVLDAVEVTEVTADLWRTWGEDGRSWFSIDTPSAVDEALARFGAPPLRSTP